MQFLLYPHNLALFVLSGVSACVAWMAWRRRRIPGAVELAWAMLATAEWNLGGAIESGVIGQANKLLWARIEYTGSVCVYPLLVMFVLIYTGRGRWLTRWNLAVLWSIPIAILALAWTNPWHGLIWSGYSPSPYGHNILIYHHGPGFWVIAGYGFLVFISLVALLGSDFFHVRRPYRLQIGALLFAGLIPVLAALAYLTNRSPIPGLDLIPLGMSAAGIVFIFAIYRLRLLDLLPIAQTALIEQVVEGVIVLDYQQRVLDLNPAAQRLLHAVPAAWIGRPIADLCAARLDYARLVFDPSLHRSVHPVANSSGLFVEAQISPLYSHKALSGWLMILRDISQRVHYEVDLREANRQLQEQIAENQALEEQLRHEAIHDYLTGLYNRRFLMEFLNHEIDQAQRGGYPISLVMIDLDHFKQFNDEYGHPAGDAVLKAVAELLQANIRGGDIACRYGGEEFLLVLPGMTLEDAGRRAEEWRLLAAATPVPFPDQPLHFSLSLGVAAFPLHGSTPEGLIAAVDVALYAAKAAGRNCTIVHSVPDGLVPTL